MGAGSSAVLLGAVAARWTFLLIHCRHKSTD
jgi:hypothetical protein